MIFLATHVEKLLHRQKKLTTEHAENQLLKDKAGKPQTEKSWKGISSQAKHFLLYIKRTKSAGNYHLLSATETKIDKEVQEIAGMRQTTTEIVLTSKERPILLIKEI